MQTGQPEAALGHLQSVAEERPQHAAAQYNLGQALTHLGRTDEAQRYLAAADSALERDVERWTALVATNPDEPARWVTFAHALRRAGRYDEATRAYTSALSLDPEHPRHPEPACQPLPGARRCRVRPGALPVHPPAPAQIGGGVARARRCPCAQQGQFEEAKQAWQTVLRYAPDHAEAKAYLAWLDDRS